jgi:hypothetical protein|tara:strand:+ start:105 stop:509 length:405 start_codon:yes stop_codon:yes gene_type:complete
MPHKRDFSFLTHVTKNKVKHIKNYLNSEERKTLIKLTSDSATLLYEHYLRMTGVENPDLSDKATEAALGWDSQKIKRHRLALQRAGWFSSERMVLPSTNAVGRWYRVGPEAVKQQTPTPSLSRRSVASGRSPES